MSAGRAASAKTSVTQATARLVLTRGEAVLLMSCCSRGVCSASDHPSVRTSSSVASLFNYLIILRFVSLIHNG